MTIDVRYPQLQKLRSASPALDRKLAGYLAATASIGAIAATDVQAIVISNPVPQNIGINGVANIDFNSDGQIDFQIDHDRVDLTPQGGPVVDYLQVDKNDINGETNPLAFDPLTGFQAATFPPNGTTPNDANNAAHLVASNPNGGSGPVEYPAALLSGADIGSLQFFDFQEGESVYGSNRTGHLNRLIDEDHGQIDMLLGGKSQSQIFTPSNTPQFIGVENLTRYLGVKMEFNDTGQINYGWIGVKITNEADATAQVVGYGYETQPSVTIQAGTTGARAGDYNNDGTVDARDYVVWKKGGPLANETVSAGVVDSQDYTPWRLNFGGTTTAASGLGIGAALPEPGTLLLSLAAGLGLCCAFLWRQIHRK